MMVNYPYYSSILFDKWNQSSIHQLSDQFQSKNAEIRCRVLQMAIYAFSCMRMAQIIPIKGKSLLLYGAVVALPYAILLKRVREGKEENGKIHKMVLAIMVANTVFLSLFRSISGVASLISFLALPICLHKRYLNQFSSSVFHFRDSQQNTLLHLAIKNNRLDIVKEIVTIIKKQYTNDEYLDYLFVVNKEGYKATHLALSLNNSLEMIKSLVGDHVYMYVFGFRDSEKNTLLHLAVKNNQLDYAKEIVAIIKEVYPEEEYKKYLSVCNKGGHNALHLAKSPEMKKLLVQAFANNEEANVDQLFEKAMKSTHREPLKYLLSLDFPLHEKYLKTAIAECELDVFRLLLEKYHQQNPLSILTVVELGSLFEFISYRNLFSLLNISPYKPHLWSHVIDDLNEVVKEKLQGSEEELNNLFKFEQMVDLSWLCKVELRGEILGEGKHLDKNNVQQLAAFKALLAMKKHEKYFKHFLIKVPAPDTPIDEFLSFIKVNKDAFHVDFVLNNHKGLNRGKLNALCYYDKIPISFGLHAFEGEEEPSKEVAKSDATKYFLLALSKKMEAITLVDIQSLLLLK